MVVVPLLLPSALHLVLFSPPPYWWLHFPRIHPLSPPNLNVDCINLARRHLQMGRVDIRVRQQPEKERTTAGASRRRTRLGLGGKRKGAEQKSRQFLSIRATSTASTAFRESMFPRIHLCLRIHSFSLFLPRPGSPILSTPPSVCRISLGYYSLSGHSNRVPSQRCIL